MWVYLTVPNLQLRSEYQVYYKIGKCISPALPDDVSEELIDFLKRFVISDCNTWPAWIGWRLCSLCLQFNKLQYVQRVSFIYVMGSDGVQMMLQYISQITPFKSIRMWDHFQSIKFSTLEKLLHVSRPLRLFLFAVASFLTRRRDQRLSSFWRVPSLKNTGFNFSFYFPTHFTRYN